MGEFIGWNTVPANKLLFAGIPLKCPYVLAGHASGCWRSALGIGMTYNREKNESLVCMRGEQNICCHKT